MTEWEVALGREVERAVPRIRDLIRKGEIEEDPKRYLGIIMEILQSNAGNDQSLPIIAEKLVPLAAAFDDLRDNFSLMAIPAANLDPTLAHEPAYLTGLTLAAVTTTTISYYHLLKVAGLLILDGDDSYFEAMHFKLLSPLSFITLLPRYLEANLACLIDAETSGKSEVLGQLYPPFIEAVQFIWTAWGMIYEVAITQRSLKDPQGALRPLRETCFSYKSLLKVHNSISKVLEASVLGQIAPMPDHLFFFHQKGLSMLAPLRRIENTMSFFGDDILQPALLRTFLETQFRMAQLDPSAEISTNGHPGVDFSLETLTSDVSVTFPDIISSRKLVNGYLQGDPCSQIFTNEALQHRLLDASKAQLTTAAAAEPTWPNGLQRNLQLCALFGAALAGLFSVLPLQLQRQFSPISLLTPTILEAIDIIYGALTGIVSSSDYPDTFKRQIIAYNYFFSVLNVFARDSIQGLERPAVQDAMISGIPLNQLPLLLKTIERLMNITTMVPSLVRKLGISQNGDDMSFYLQPKNVALSYAAATWRCWRLKESSNPQAFLEFAPQLKIPELNAFQACLQAWRAGAAAPIEAWAEGEQYPDDPFIPGTFLSDLAYICEKIKCCIVHTKQASVDIATRRTMRYVEPALVLGLCDALQAVPQRYYEDLAVDVIAYVRRLDAIHDEVAACLETREVPGLDACVQMCKFVERKLRGGQAAVWRQLILGKAGEHIDVRKLRIEMESLKQVAAGAGDEGRGDRAVERAKALMTLPCSRLGCPTMREYGKERISTRLCAGCQSVRYCSQRCQKKDWKEHKVVCKMLAARLEAGIEGGA